MSDSDDTDELLLIPPDFFLVESDSENLVSTISSNDLYFSIVDSLITQVNHLEKKVNSISEINSLSVSLDENSSFFMPQNKKFCSFEDLQRAVKTTDCWSAHSTPSKLLKGYTQGVFSEKCLNSTNIKREHLQPPPKFPMKSFHLSPKAAHQEETSKNKDKYSEIDNFIKCVKNIQKLSSIKYCNKGNDVEKDTEEFSNLIEEKLATPKYISRNLFPLPNSDYFKKVNLWQRNIDRFIQENNINQVPQKLEQSEKIYPETKNEEEDCSNLSVSSQLTALHNFNSQKPTENNDVTEETIKLSVSPSKNRECSSEYNNRGDGIKIDPSQVPKPNSSLAFLSLHDLWNKTADNFEEGDSFLLKKLEEEKLMRNYCEELIQQQQKCILDLQERISVAVQVDQAKDEAIEGFFDEWYKLQSKIKLLQEDVHVFKQKYQESEEDKRTYIIESTEKIKSLEDEMSKTFLLANNSQEKVVTLEKQNAELRNRVQNADEKYNNAQVQLATEKKKNLQFLNTLDKKEEELAKAMKASAAAEDETNQNRKMMELCQHELMTVKTRLGELQRQLQDEKEWNKDFETQKARLFQEIEAHRKTEITLREEISKLKESNEKMRVDLRNFYQEQVEMVVREKLKEFQGQLEKAENNLQFELRAQEKSFAKAAATHIYQITEKHNMEVQLLEERHREEVRLHKLQLSQARQQLEATRAKLQRQQERIVEQLYKAMEAQWIEALKVIEGGAGNINSSPSTSIPNDPTLGDRLNFLKSTSYNSFERILSQNVNQVLANDNNNQSETITTTAEEQHQIREETPLSSRTLKSKQEIENELHKYIQS
ncbi:myosin heavy chain, skeletal muscle, adult isoform X2 [Agrilus planipennis]|nr:myosin heavy chain, skeletal muscle, adult isoform X2 [Agrilus planipennis]